MNFGDIQRSLTGGSENSSSSFIDPTQQPFLKDIYGQAKSLYGNVDPREQYGVDALYNRGMYGSPLNFGAGAELMKTLSGGYMPGSEAFGANLKSMYNQILPEVNSTFGGAGRFGGGLHKIGLENRMADAGQQLYNQERNRMMGAVGMAPEIANQDYTDINAVMQAGAFPWMNLNRYSSLIGGPTVLNQSQGTQQRGLTQGFQDVFGGGSGGGASAAMSMFGGSDRRIKKNVKQIDTLPNGLAWYEFDYITMDELIDLIGEDPAEETANILGDIWGQHSQGVMAGEAEKVIPDAVEVLSTGIMAVDYAKLVYKRAV